MTSPLPTDTPSVSDAERAFLTRRVSLFGLVAGGLSFAFLVWRVVEIELHGDYPLSKDALSLGTHLAAALALLLLWGVAATGERSARVLRGAEAAALLVACGCYAAMAFGIPVSARPDYILLLAISFVFLARSIYIPSSARRSLLLGLVIGATLVTTIYLRVRPVPPDTYLPPGSGWESLGAAEISTRIAVGVAAWWILMLTLGTATSGVIYGLRRAVDRARRLGQYTLLEKIGEGGMGAVYRARHAMLRRPTAVKLLPPDKAGAAALSRFEKEVQTTSMLTHVNTVTIYDYGRTRDGVFYYAMELLDGPTLEQVVRRDGPQSPARVVHFLEQAAGALSEAHHVGLIHRDVKPSNLMVVERGEVSDVLKVLDFGLVKEIRAPGTQSLTQADAVTGTPQYMAPEAILSPDRVDGRSDLYGLGAVAYFLLAGVPVFEGRTLVEVCTHHLHTEPVPPSQRLGRPLPVDLEALTLRCLAKDPDDRPASAAELRDSLRALGEHGRWSEDEARAWWSLHGTEVRPSQSAPASTAPGPLTVALDSRR